MLEASSSLGSTKLIATRAYQSSDLKQDLRLETGAASAQGAYDARLSSRRNRKRGDQGVDALHYTERTGTASNDLAVWLVGCGWVGCWRGECA